MKRFLSLLLVFALVLSCTPMMPIQAQAATGEQSAFEGYTPVSNKEELDAVRDALNGKYYLTADIVFTDEDFAEGGAFYNNGAKWIPIGTSSAPFTGTFDGNGHTITGLSVLVKNTENAVGGLFGYVSSSNSEYGIFNLGMISDYILVSNASGRSYAGSIAGYCETGKIEGCYHTGHVAATNTSGEIYAGGIVGYKQYGEINKCYNVGSVVGGGITGGIVGGTTYASVSNCYNNTEFDGKYAGGIVGSASFGSVDTCYSLGTNSSSYGSGFAGGIVGMNSNCTVSNSYYDAATTSGGGTYKSKSSMQIQSTFSGFDFTDIWTMDGNSDFPYPELQGVIMQYKRTLTSISVNKLPTKTVYLLNEEELDVTGGVITLTYNDGTISTVVMTADMVTGFDNTVSGIQTLTVSYNGKTATFAVTVNAPVILNSISVSKLPNKTEYVLNEEKLDVTGGMITLTYSDGTTSPVAMTADMVTGFDNSVPGAQTLTVTYNGKTATFAVTVNAPVILNSISVSKLPNKTEYVLNEEELNVTGGMITLTYSDGTTSTVAMTADMVTGFDNTVRGEQVLTITYGGKTATFTVTLEIPNSCGENVTYTLTDGVLTISGSGPMADYASASASPWYSQRELITQIIVEDGVTTIGDRAFYNYTSLLQVQIGQNVRTIGTYAFRGCAKLTEITLPDSITELKDSAFRSCSDLANITMLGNAPVVGSYVFTDCAADIRIQYYEDRTGYDVSPWTTHSLTVIHIGQWVIDTPATCTQEGSRHMTCTVCGETVTETIPSHSYVNGVCTLCGEAKILYSGNCGANVNWKLDSLGKLIISGTGSMTNYSYGSAPWCAYWEQIKSAVIQNGVTYIGRDAFYYCSSLTSITIPESVTSIGSSAFSGCSSLTGVYITDIAAWCNISFYNDSSNPLSDAKNLYLNGELVTELVIPDSVTSIGNYMFDGCSSLTSITIPESVTSIGSSAFSGCSSLTSITIPESVTSIGSSAFSGCSSLTAITIPESVTSIGHSAFRNCSSLTSITIPESVTSIGSSTFWGCSSLTAITIPESVTSIGDYAFYHCSGLTAITIPDRVTSIGDYAFYHCSSLTSITIPEGVTSIGDYAFYYCSSLTSVTIPDSVTSIGDYAFYNCRRLTHVAYTGTQTQWNSISIGSSNTNLTNTTRHYETRFQNVDNCVETGVYCPVCKLYITRTVKEDSAHTYSDNLDVSCNACDYSRTAIGLSIQQLPEKLGYVLFEDALDITGGQLQLAYDDGSVYTIAMTLDMVTGFDNTIIGVQNLTVACGGLTATYTVEIAAQVPERVQIESLPDKLSYVTGDTLDLTGLTLTAIYKDGQQATVTAADVQGFADMTTPGVTTATVTFQGKQATFAIYVHPRGGMATVDSSLYPESAHDYSNNMNETKTLTVPGASKLVLTFNSSSATETDCDYVYVLDGNGNQIDKYTGSFGGTVATVPGDTVKIRLTSDSSTVKYGYAFSKIEADIGMTHPEVVLPGYPATFARPGLTEGAKCEICGEILRQQQEIPQLVGRVANWNMTVADDLKVNFYLEISDEIVNTTTVSLIINGDTQSYRASDLTETADGTYLVTANISAAQINDDIVIMISSGSYLTTSATYSAKQYCDTLLGDEQYSQYHALVKEMLNYGAMAQLYFDHGTDDLVNNHITGAAKEDIPEQAEKDMTISGSIESISFYGASLVFKDRIAVRYYFRYDGDLSQYSFSAGSLPITYIIKDGMLCIEVADILPQNLDQQIALTVTDANGSELSVTYGPMNYIVRMNEKGSAALQNLVKALYNYHLAAKTLQETV